MGSATAGTVIAFAGLPGVDHDPSRVRETARDLLADPPFREEPRGIIEEFAVWLGERLATGLAWLLDAFAGQGSLLAWVVVAVATVLLVIAVWHWTRGTLAGRSVRPAAPSAPRRSAEDWLVETREHEAAGRWREAVRARYGALVAALIESGIVDELPGRTVRELDREVAVAAPTLAGSVRRAGERFEAVWYGNVAAHPDDAAVVGEALAAVGGRRRTGVGAAS